MKNVDLLNALGEVSEKTVQKYALPDSSNIERATEDTIMEKDTANQEPIIQTKKKTSRISMGTAAAAVALCVGLNAAVFFGIHKMRQNSSPAYAPDSAAEIVDLDQTYMELIEACPTGIAVQFVNETTYNPQFIIQQNGEKVCDAQMFDMLSYDQEEVYHNFRFEQLPAGCYTLVNLAADGESEDVLGHLDFEISAEFDNMVYIRDLSGTDALDAEDYLEENGLISIKCCKSNDPFTNEMLTGGGNHYTVVSIEPQNTFYHTDGDGYWVTSGDTILLNVVETPIPDDAPGDMVSIPDCTGWAYEEAKEAITAKGLYVYKSFVYDRTVPEGKVIATDPEGPADIEIGSYVRVFVSSGATPVINTVPDFVNMQWEAAQETAESLGFRLRCTAIPDDAPADTILNQNVKPGEKVSADTIIDLTVSAGPDKTNTKILLSFDMPEDVSGQYHVYVQNTQDYTIALGDTFDPVDAEGTFFVAVEGYEQNKEVRVILVNDGNGMKSWLGSYMLHFDTQTYETITEDIAAAFDEVQEVR